MQANKKVSCAFIMSKLKEVIEKMGMTGPEMHKSMMKLLRSVNELQRDADEADRLQDGALTEKTLGRLAGYHQDLIVILHRAGLPAAIAGEFVDRLGEAARLGRLSEVVLWQLQEIEINLEISIKQKLKVQKSPILVEKYKEGKDKSEAELLKEFKVVLEPHSLPKQAPAGIDWSGVHEIVDSMGRDKAYPYRISSKQSKLPYDIYVFASDGQINIGVTSPMFSSTANLGRGNHGLVKQLICYNGNVYALKIQYQEEKEEKKSLAKEIHALKKTREWVADFDIVHDDTDKDLQLGSGQVQVGEGAKLSGLIEKFHKGEELEHFFAKKSVRNQKNGMISVKLDNWEKMIIAQNMAIALQKLHNVNIGHNDIKPKNFLINESTLDIELVDFGEAQDNSDPSRPAGANAFYGSPYVKEANMHSHMQRDIYSLARVFEVELGLQNIVCDNDHIKKLITRMKTNVLGGAPKISEIVGILSELSEKLGFRQLYEATIGKTHVQQLYMHSAPAMIRKEEVAEKYEEAAEKYEEVEEEHEEESDLYGREFR